MNCPCCGGKMETTHIDNLTVFKCNRCGLSNTELKKDLQWIVKLLPESSIMAK